MNIHEAPQSSFPTLAFPFVLPAWQMKEQLLLLSKNSDLQLMYATFPSPLDLAPVTLH